MNFASAVVLIVIVLVMFVAVRQLLKNKDGCAACGTGAKGGCSGCSGCSAGQAGGCAFHYDPEAQKKADAAAAPK
ncbi:MAG: hypothetical protein LKF34_00870 [Acidaminococcaceae bacterium]|jgi:hypothetical protein|nr:hypothetical protein [Acidaminococcaceae bacterium]